MKRLKRLVNVVSGKLQCPFSDAETCEVYIREYINILRENEKRHSKKYRELLKEIDIGLAREEKFEETIRHLLLRNIRENSKKNFRISAGSIQIEALEDEVENLRTIIARNN